MRTTSARRSVTAKTETGRGSLRKSSRMDSKAEYGLILDGEGENAGKGEKRPDLAGRRRDQATMGGGIAVEKRTARIGARDG